MFVRNEIELTVKGKFHSVICSAGYSSQLILFCCRVAIGKISWIVRHASDVWSLLLSIPMSYLGLMIGARKTLQATREDCYIVKKICRRETLCSNLTLYVAFLGRERPRCITHMKYF